MTRDEALNDATAMANGLSVATDGIELDVGLKPRLSAACQFAALDHHAGIVLLFQHQIPAPALALLRCLYECYIRGAWLFHCATDEQLSDYSEGKDIPPIARLVGQLESSGVSAEGIISDAHGRNWRAQNGLTHGGIELAMRHLSAEAIERNCSDEEAIEALGYANAIAGLAAMQVAVIADKPEVCEKILEIGRTCFGSVAVQ